MGSRGTTVEPAVSRRLMLRGSAGVVGTGVLLGIAGPLAVGSVATAATPNLSRGSTGRAVTALQQRLANNGYWCGAADGVFGHLTQQAVWAVQKVNGLYRDGIVGPLTNRALDSGYRPAPVGGSGNRMTVLLASQVILVQRGGRTTEIYNTSTGNGEVYWLNGRRYTATTPRGSYSVYSTYSSGWQWGPLGNLYRPMYFNGGIAVHGSESIPTYPASHGCCRLSTAAMDRVWAKGYLSMGMGVTVA